jgi:hypothetical protein
MTVETRRVGRVQVLLLCAAALLCACNRDSASTPQSASITHHVKPKAPPVAKLGPTAAEQTAGMVEAAAQGKSSIPVELKFDIPQRPKVGQPLQVDLALVANISAAPATLQMSGADLSLAPGANQFEFPSEEAGEVYRHTVSITPNAEGVLLLGVTVVLKHDEVTDQRVFSIPIIAER